MSRLEEPPLAQVVALPLTRLSDAELLAAVVRGDARAPDAVWNRFSGLVRGVLMQMLGPSADVEDHVQETFVRLFRRAPDIQDPAALSSFILGIAFRIARADLRKRRVRRWVFLTDDGQVPDVESVGTDFAAREATRRLYVALDKLDPDSRNIVILRHVRGIELTELATIVGCSLATVKRRLSKATSRLLAIARRDPALLAYVAQQGLGGER